MAHRADHLDLEEEDLIEEEEVREEVPMVEAGVAMDHRHEEECVDLHLQDGTAVDVADAHRRVCR
jgi:hypothetical protein